jgi:hypothetical protein
MSSCLLSRAPRSRVADISNEIPRISHRSRELGVGVLLHAKKGRVTLLTVSGKTNGRSSRQICQKQASDEQASISISSSLIVSIDSPTGPARFSTLEQ